MFVCNINFFLYTLHLKIFKTVTEHFNNSCTYAPLNLRAFELNYMFRQRSSVE